MILANLLLQHMGAFNFVHFIVGFLLVVCAIAIVIICVKWLAGLAGEAVPPPLMLVLGILLFIVLLLMLLNWSGLAIW
jgi:hypothetical protein